MTFEGMFGQAKERLLPHVGHDIEVMYYGTEKFPINIAIECMDCNEVLVDFTPEEETILDKGRPHSQECGCDECEEYNYASNRSKGMTYFEGGKP